MDVRINAVPNVGATCYLLQAFVLLYLIGGWKEGSPGSTIGVLSLRLLRSMDPSNKEDDNPSGLVKEIVESLFPGEKNQQDLLVAFELISGGLLGTGQHLVLSEHWTSCPCGLSSVKFPESENVIVVSTDQAVVNLEDMVNSEVGCDKEDEEGWKCPSKDCDRRKETTKLSTHAGVGKIVLVYITRPFDRPRTSVKVPKQMMIATYQEGQMEATLVPAYLVYVVCHSTGGGDVPDEDHPESVSAAQAGHYFGCACSQNGVDGITVDCLAEPGETRVVDFNKWVEERTKKVTMAVFTTEIPSWSGAELLLHEDLELEVSQASMDLKRKHSTKTDPDEADSEKKQKTTQDSGLSGLVSEEASKAARVASSVDTQMKLIPESPILSISPPNKRVCGREEIVSVCAWGRVIDLFLLGAQGRVGYVTGSRRRSVG